MKPEKTTKKGRKPSREKATSTGEEGKKAAPARAVKVSGAGAVAGKKKTPAKTLAANSGVSGRTKTAKTGMSGVKSAGAGVPKKTPSRKNSPAKAVRKNVSAEKTPEAERTVRTTKKSTKSVSASPGSRRKGATATGRRTVKAGEAGSGVPVKKSSARVLPKQPGVRLSSPGKSQSMESPATRLPAGVREILPPPLPEGYGENEFFLIPVEPRVVYACWEIGKDSMPEGEGRLEVRFFDAAQGEDGRAFLEIFISDRIGDAFFNIAAQGKEIIAEIGHTGADGRFVHILKSRKILLPSSFEGDEGVAVRLPERDSYGSRPPGK